MANEIFENMWKIMKENKFQYVDQINNDLICKICNKLMIKASNVPCGCRYCFDCITNYLDGRKKFCPGTNKYCKNETINPGSDVVIESSTNVRISEVVVKCPIKNCEFTAEFSSIENHMTTCDKNPTSCPYFDMGCKNDELIIDEMKDHLCTEIFCHTKLLLDFINNLRNEMELMKNDIVELKLENKHLKEELEIIKIDTTNNKMKNEEFEKKINNNLSEIEELNEEMVVIKNENKSMMKKLENIGELQIEIKRQIDEIMKKSNINNNDEKINNLQTITIMMERISEIINNFGEFEWKIDNLSKQPEQTDIYSESFYSHRNGYKMCLSVWIGGFIGVYFHLMRGEFDNDLLWPFKYIVTIDIINPIDGTVYVSKSIKYDDLPNIKGWYKPTKVRNERISLLTIDNPNKIIQNNQMLIKCKINI